MFDGRNPPYGENDAPNPLNLYGKSKLEGEREVLRHNPGMWSEPLLFSRAPVLLMTLTPMVNGGTLDLEAMLLTETVILETLRINQNNMSCGDFDPDRYPDISWFVIFGEYTGIVFVFKVAVYT